MVPLSAIGAHLQTKFYQHNTMSCLGSGFASSTLPMSMPSHDSPEPRVVDAFINDLLQAVSNEDIPICTSCEEGATATSRCRDCSELLCDPCVRAHQRVRLTKDHQIVPFVQGSSSAPANLNVGSQGSSQSSSSPCSSGLGPGAYCELHHEPHRLYCETCPSAICTECTLLEHRGHQLIYLQDAIDGARTNALKLIVESRTAMAAISEALEGIQSLTENVEINSHKAANDIRSSVRKLVLAIEERERELLTRIEHLRQSKGKILMVQMDNLRHALAKLNRTSDQLTEFIDSNSGTELILMNEKATAELRQVRSIRSKLIPDEDDNIAFIPPESGLLRAVASFGNISTMNVMLSRTRSKDVLLNYPSPIEQKENKLESLPRGRPIHGTPLPIVVKESHGSPTTVFGTEGEGEGQLCRPWGVCCDRQGHIIIADRSNNRIQIFNLDGTFSHKFGNQGIGPGQFDRPAGVAVCPVGRLIVADKDNHRIQIFTVEGMFLLTFGDKGCRNGQFNYPWDIAVNSLGHIVVSDTRNHRIQLFTAEGIFINKYGFEGTAAMWKHFDSPRGVCFTPSGSVIVTDFNNHRLVVIDAKFSNAQFLGQEGSGFKQFLRPQGIACDDEGKIVVADSRNNRIQVFESGGAFLWKLGQPGKNLGELDRPSGVCISPEGHIVVVDFGNNRVQIF